MTEQSLHNKLKEYYSGPGDDVEHLVDGYIIDIVRGGQLIEVQTGNFSSIKQKLYDLLGGHRVLLVYPIPYKKWVTRVDLEGKRLSRRKSPKTGRVEELFNELVYLPEIMLEPRFELEVPLVNVDEILVDDGKGSWRRRRWSVQDRELLSVEGSTLFSNREDLLTLLPGDLPPLFTTRDLSKQSGLRIRLAQRMAYCLRQLKLLDVTGKRGRSYIYRLNQSS